MNKSTIKLIKAAAAEHVVHEMTLDAAEEGLLTAMVDELKSPRYELTEDEIDDALNLLSEIIEEAQIAAAEAIKQFKI